MQHRRTKHLSKRRRHRHSTRRRLSKRSLRGGDYFPFAGNTNATPTPTPTPTPTSAESSAINSAVDTTKNFFKSAYDETVSDLSKASNYLNSLTGTPTSSTPTTQSTGGRHRYRKKTRRHYRK